MTGKTVSFTLLALVAFAANSVLCRLALKDGLIDPVAFTQLRIVSGAVFLAPFLIFRKASAPPRSLWVRFRGAIALSVYAFAFSLAYVSLDAGVGALILFGMVQLTMIAFGLASGERLSALQWGGALVSIAGLLLLLAPAAAAPPLGGAALMAIAGVAWGAYSLIGRKEPDPTRATAFNFVAAAVFASLLFLIDHKTAAFTGRGALLAALSGVVASGAGYVIWYQALRGLSRITAAVAQLSVPVIAAIGGVAFLDETLSLRLAAASILVLGGIYLTARRRALPAACEVR